MDSSVYRGGRRAGDRPRRPRHGASSCLVAEAPIVLAGEVRDRARPPPSRRRRTDRPAREGVRRVVIAKADDPGCRAAETTVAPALGASRAVTACDQLRPVCRATTSSWGQWTGDRVRDRPPRRRRRLGVRDEPQLLHRSSEVTSRRIARAARRRSATDFRPGHGASCSSDVAAIDLSTTPRICTPVRAGDRSRSTASASRAAATLAPRGVGAAWPRRAWGEPVVVAAARAPGAPAPTCATCR